MNISKRVLMGCLIAGLSTSMMAKDFKSDLSIGLSQLSIIDGEDGANLSLGYGVTKQFDNKMIMGVSIGVEYANAGDYNIFGISGDLKVGYQLLDSVNVYTLGGYRIQNFDDTSSYGFGYGAGVEYLFTNNISAALEYKTYVMTCNNRSDYDFNTVGVKLKYIF